ncbi:MAG: uroporphyrinogen-III synthase [Acidobacteriota bacterium]
MIVADAEQAKRGLEGLRVLSLESRRAGQMAQLIANYGGVAISAPSMREIPLKENPDALAFAEELFAGKLDGVIFLTGVGTRILFGAVETKHPREKLVEALSQIVVVARGPKPVAALREFGVPITIVVPEPNTWRDILKILESYQPAILLAGKRIAVQEYGVPNQELVRRLEKHGVEVQQVPVYRWALPEDTAPLVRAIGEIAGGKIDLLLVTSAQQIHNLMQVASRSGTEEQVCRGLERSVVASIGPITSEALGEHGIRADFEPSPPKMGQLVYDAAKKAGDLLRQKRGESSH